MIDVVTGKELTDEELRALQGAALTYAKTLNNKVRKVTGPFQGMMQVSEFYSGSIKMHICFEHDKRYWAGLEE